MKWISVKDEMPSYELDGFLAWDGENIEYCHAYGCSKPGLHGIPGTYEKYGEWCFMIADEGVCRNNFTHWMPLPEPPEENE